MKNFNRFFVKLKSLISTSISTTSDLNRFDPDPDNPNRCMKCLVEQGGTPGRMYIPASDSMFFDTGVCGTCGDLNEVCDPILLDAYHRAGMNVSLVPQSLIFSVKYNLTRLRVRHDSTGPLHGKAKFVEQVSLENAVEKAKSYIDDMREIHDHAAQMGQDQRAKNSMCQSDENIAENYEAAK